MKSFVKSSIRKLVFKGQSPKKYFPVKIFPAMIAEKVMLISGENRMDITDKHCIVCQTPFCIAVWMPPGQFSSLSSGRFKVQIIKEGKVNAMVKVSSIHKTEENNQVVVICRIEKVRCYNLNLLHQFILMKYFLRKGKNTFREGMIYGALYSYPRSIITVSYKEDGYYNIFPMDFQGYSREGNMHIFGLRTTNITLEKILHSKRIVIGDTDGVSISTIYALGSHHSGQPPLMEDLPFKVIESERFKFPVPAFTGSYKEVELIQSRKLGSHMMLIGRVINEKQLREQITPLYHVHFFQFIRSKYPAV